MFNLLLQSDKKNLYREYMMRLIVVILFAVFMIGAIGAVFLLPSYLWLWNTERSAHQRVRELTISNHTDGELEAMLQNAKTKVAMLRTSKDTTLSELILDITRMRGTGILLTSISYRDDTGRGTFMISGTSKTRENLVIFSRTISNNPRFGTVDLPLSNFVKDKDIPFSLTIQQK